MSKSFLTFYLYADTCVSEHMDQDNNNEELQQLEHVLFEISLFWDMRICDQKKRTTQDAKRDFHF